MSIRIQDERPSWPPLATWPMFRFAAVFKGSTWEVTDAVTDEELAARGYKHGSPWRYAGRLDGDEQRELYRLLTSKKKDLAPEERRREMELLACCDFTGPFPPIDFDVSEKGTAEDARAAAARFVPAFEAVLGGRLALRLTGGSKGGIHADQVAPPEVKSPLMLLVWRELVTKVAREVGIPLQSDYAMPGDRPPVTIDDGLFNRQPESRGVLWRLVGSRREDNGKIKLPLDPSDVPGRDAQHPYGYPLPATNTEMVRNALYAEERRRDAAEQQPTPDPAKVGKRKVLDGFGKEPLRRLAKVIRDHLPPSGKRHEMRKALAGWLIRKGIPVETVSRTLVAAGDSQDAFATTQSTAERLEAGEKAVGWTKLVRLVGEVVAPKFADALNLDLLAANHFGALDRFLNDRERDTLNEAAQLAFDAGRKTQGRALTLAAACGLYTQRADCADCGQEQKRFKMVAERAACPHCAWARGLNLFHWFRDKWPKRVALMIVKLNDLSVEAAKRRRAQLRKDVGSFDGKHVRWILAPGYVVAVTVNDYAAMQITASVGAKFIEAEFADWVGQIEFTHRMAPVIAARTKLLRTYLAQGDVKSLAMDDWGGRVMETAASRPARAALPWPTKPQLREYAKAAARAERVRRHGPEPEDDGTTPCCGVSVAWHVMNEHGQTVCRRMNHAWTFAEAYVQVNGLNADAALARRLPLIGNARE